MFIKSDRRLFSVEWVRCWQPARAGNSAEGEKKSSTSTNLSLMGIWWCVGEEECCNFVHSDLTCLQTNGDLYALRIVEWVSAGDVPSAYVCLCELVWSNFFHDLFEFAFTVCVYTVHYSPSKKKIASPATVSLPTVFFLFFSVSFRSKALRISKEKKNYHHFPFFLNSRETVRFSQMTCEAKRKASERLAGECETVALSLP